jgi:hypothetical protein
MLVSASAVTNSRPVDRRAPHQNPLILLALVAFLAALIVQPGDLSSSDTTRRLQTTHSFWTSAPPVRVGDYPAFGLVGRQGRIYSWYGMGQSVLMLPADMVATTAMRFIPALGRHPEFRSVFVSYTVSISVCVLAVLVCFRFLLLLGFTPKQSSAGALTLLFATTFLYYTQNLMENNFMLLLTLTGFCFQYEWVKTNSTTRLILGAVALGADLLTRLTTGLDLAACVLFVVLCVWSRSGRSGDAARRLLRYALITVPCYFVFFAIERAYNFYRFGTLIHTYASIFAVQYRQLHPNLPLGFPLNTPFWKGFLGPFFAPEKSIFLFDPMLVITAILIILVWNYFGTEVRAFLTSTVILLFVYVAFHARISYEGMLPLYAKGWAGDVAWGDRYITSPVQLLAMMSMPLLLRYWASIRPVIRKTAVAITTAAICVQLGSTIFWSALEFCQQKTLAHPVFVVGLRFVNIVAVALGKTTDWRLSNDLTVQSSHNYIPNFFPIWLLNKMGSFHWIAMVLLGVWVCLIVCLVLILFTVFRDFSGDSEWMFSLQDVPYLLED